MKTAHLNQKYAEYKAVSQSTIDQLLPFIEKTPKPRQKVVWMDEEFRSNRRKKRQLERKWRKNRSEQNREKYITHVQKCQLLSRIHTILN